MPQISGRLKLRHYRLIRAISDCGQISIAAERLAITQPAASRTLKEIESILGQPIFLRHPKGMTPTPIGEVLSRHAEAVTNELSQADDELLAFNAGRSGAARIGAVTGAAVGYVVPAIQEMGVEGADISVEVAPSHVLMDRLMRGELDFALCRVPQGTDVHRLEILGGRVEELMFLVRQGHPFLDRKKLSITDLRDLVWVTQESGMPIRQAIEQAFLTENISPPRSIINSPSILFMTAYLLSSDAVTAVASEAAKLFTSSQSNLLRVLDMEKANIMTPYHLIRESSRQVNPLTERLLGLVAENMRRY